MELSSEYIQSLKKIPNLDVAKLQQSFLNEAKVGVRFNSKKITEDINLESAQNFLKSFEIDGKLSQVKWCKNGFCFDGKERLGKILPHEMGAYYLQEPSAMAPVNFLDIKTDDVVLDLCASPGGKSTQIAEKLKDGFLVANEIVQQRAKVLAENVARLGLDNVVITNHSPIELEDRFGKLNEDIIIYMYSEWFDKMAEAMHVSSVRELRNSIEITFPKEVVEKMDTEEIFMDAFHVTTMFRFISRGNNLVIILDTIKLDKHPIYYLVELMSKIYDKFGKNID